jgi:hypothetical protein
MESADGILKSLEIKVKQLADLYVKTKQERDLLINQSVIQQKTIEEKETEIEKLRAEIQAMKTAGSGGREEEVGMMKERISGLVREIDRCIELLNK